MLRTLAPVFLGVILFIAGRPADAFGGTAVARNVVIVVIDGLRNDEAFDYPQHTYIPRNWNDLRPLGTINTNFWNTSLSATTPGHIQMLSGVRQLLHLELSDSGKVVSRYPTILENYRKEKNIPKGKVWVISGKGEYTNSINTSLHPDYAGWEASKDNLHRTDLFRWEAVKHRIFILSGRLFSSTFAFTDIP